MPASKKEAVVTAYFTDADGKSYSPGDKYMVSEEEVGNMIYAGHAKLVHPTKAEKEQANG